MEFSSRHVQVSAQRSLAATTSPLVARMKRNGMDPGALICDAPGGAVIFAVLGVFVDVEADVVLGLDATETETLFFAISEEGDGEVVGEGGTDDRDCDTDAGLPVASGGSGLDLFLGIDGLARLDAAAGTESSLPPAPFTLSISDPCNKSWLGSSMH